MHCLSADDTKISFLKDFSRCVLLDKGKDLAQGIRVSKMIESSAENLMRGLKHPQPWLDLHAFTRHHYFSVAILI